MVSRFLSDGVLVQRILREKAGYMPAFLYSYSVLGFLPRLAKLALKPDTEPFNGL